MCWQVAGPPCHGQQGGAGGSQRAQDRGEDWKIEAEASPAPTEGHALEQALTEQVEEGPAGGVGR